MLEYFISRDKKRGDQKYPESHQLYLNQLLIVNCFQPEFTAMREQYMRKGEGFIICYSITDRRSFEEAVEYKKLIDRVRNRDDIPVVLVGNKSDLEPARKVSQDFLFI